MLLLLLQANIDSTVDMEEFRFLLTGGISAGEVPPNPLPWLGDKLWAEMNRLSSFLGFVGFAEELHRNPVSPFQLTDLRLWCCNTDASNTYLSHWLDSRHTSFSLLCLDFDSHIRLPTLNLKNSRSLRKLMSS